MNWLDITILIIIFLFTLLGISRGLVSQVFSLVALAGGIIMGFIFYDVLGAFFIEESLVENKSIANVGGFIILAFITYVIIQLLGWLTTKIIGTLKLGWLNRLCGGVLGALFGVAAAFLLLSSLTLFYSKNDAVFRKSVMVPYLNEASLVARHALPEDFKESFESAKELIRKEGLKAAMKIKDSDKVKDIFDRKEDAARKTDQYKKP
ncbi:MAG: CvpA family protein [Deltaproteobacteria bacterium]